MKNLLGFLALSHFTIIKHFFAYFLQSTLFARWIDYAHGPWLPHELFDGTCSYFLLLSYLIIIKDDEEDMRKHTKINIKKPCRKHMIRKEWDNLVLISAHGHSLSTTRHAIQERQLRTTRQIMGTTEQPCSLRYISICIRRSKYLVFTRCTLYYQIQNIFQ